GKSIEVPMLVLANQQSAGRGQQGRTWWSDDGALTFSLIVEPAGCAPLSLIMGLAVAKALAGLLPDENIRLKWPNDVLVDGRKVGGILVESPSAARYQVIGVGCNIHNSAQQAPEELQDQMIALCDLQRQPPTLYATLCAILKEFAALHDNSQQPSFDLVGLWSPYCALTGHHVRLQNGAGLHSGVCHGIDHNGALLLAGDQGTTAVSSGHVLI
ncbi:MAG: biotin--[acetyl-CoA-carboxylase] ligase, partial [Planctomycetales bacterium]